MKQTDPQYKLRLPQRLKEEIEAAAMASGRSMNAEIVARLQATFPPNVESVDSHAATPGSGIIESAMREAAHPFGLEKIRAEIENSLTWSRQRKEEMVQKELDDLKKLIADAVGPTIEDQMQKLMNDQRRFLQEMASTGIVNGALNAKPKR